MSDKADIELDISAVIDRKEAVALMEPLLIAEGSRHRGELTDLAIEVAARSAGFRRSLQSQDGATYWVKRGHLRPIS